MPRKPSLKKEVRTLRGNGKDVQVSFFPPQGRNKSWYAYWKGLPTRKSTKERSLERAIESVERELFDKQDASSSSLMTDEEFDEIQRRHYERMNAKQDSVDANREAISAFRTITGIVPIVAATADDCSRFQDEALLLPRNWRMPYSDETRREAERANHENLSVATVLKWSSALRAAFNRANSNAGRRCVRNVVSKDKLLTTNPWDEFTWIEGEKVDTVRQFTSGELISIVEFFEQNYEEVSAAKLAALVFFWSCARRREISTLKWDSLRIEDDEIHFDIIGKWNVRKWFRLPSTVYEELCRIRTDSPYVFAVYPDQLCRHLSLGARQSAAMNVRSDFKPENFGNWFYLRIVEWAKSQADCDASV